MRDEAFKYGGAFEYFLKGKSYTSFGFGYRNDVEQLGQGFSTFAMDNVLVTIFSRIRNTKFNTIIEEKIFFETDPFKGFTTNVSVTHKEMDPLNDLSFTYYTDATHQDTSRSINTSEITFTLRYAYNERFIERKKSVGRKSGRISLGSLKPITRLSYTLGVKDLLGSTLNYHKVILNIRDRLYWGILGRTDYEIETGKVWKVIPYPLLEVHKGNETYIYDRTTFNQMNHYEFVSDQFASVRATHRFNGFFLDKLPLLRKLKLREVATANFLLGKVGVSNLDIMIDPTTFYSVNKMYVEAGVGIENIFKFGRIDLIKRFSHLNHPDISNFGLRFSFEIII